MSYAFDMSFAMAADEKEAFVLARHYVEKCMEKKNARKFIEDNTIYIPSIRYSHVEKANNMAEVADRYWLETLFKFRFLYWPKYRQLGLVGSNRIDDPAFPMSIYFQNSTDQNDDFGDVGNKYPLFWVKYDDLAPFLAKQQLMTSNVNNAAVMSAEDYFTKNLS